MGTRIKLEQQSQRKVELGQLRVMLLSEAFATRGVEKYLDPLYRDPTIGTRVFLAVISDGTAENVLSTKLKTGDEQPGIYISDLIQQNIDNNAIPIMNFHLFLYGLYSDARDPYLPTLIIKK